MLGINNIKMNVRNASYIILLQKYYHFSYTNIFITRRFKKIDRFILKILHLSDYNYRWLSMCLDFVY